MPLLDQKIREIPVASELNQPTHSPLSAAQRQTGQKLMTYEGMLWAFMNALVVPGGVVLTGFALYLKADAFGIGLVSALPLLAALLQLWSHRAVIFYGGRKRACVMTLGAARLLLIPLAVVALAAWLWPQEHTVWLIAFLGILSLSAALTAVGGTVWLSWAASVVPIERRAFYFAQRNTILGAAGLVMTLVAGFWMDWWVEPTPTGHQTRPVTYLFLFAVATVFGIVTVPLLRRTPDADVKDAPASPGLWVALRATRRHRPLWYFLLFRSAWLFSVGLVVPYYTVYMLQDLRLSFTEISLLQNIGVLAGLLSTPLWGRLLDRWGCSRVILWTSWLKIAYALLWMLVTPENPFWPLLLLHVSLVVDAGLALGAGNLLMNLMPHEGAGNVAYFGIFSGLTSLTSAIGPLLGGILISLMSNRLEIFGLSLGTIQFLFLLSAGLRVLSLVFFRNFSDKPEPTRAY